MTLGSNLALFAGELNRESIPFAIIGGMAMFAYGSDRTTFDVDFLIHGQHKSVVSAIAHKLNFKVINQNPETMQLSGPISVDIIFANRELSQKMLERARPIPHFTFPVVTPEDLIGLKIQAFVGDRSREYIDKNDILTLFKLFPNLDFKLIKQYADIFNVWTEIEDLKKHV